MYLLLINTFATDALYGCCIARPIEQRIMICQYHESYGACFFQHGLKQKTPRRAGLSLYLGFVVLQITR